MIGKPLEGTRGSGQPRVLQTVGAQTAVILQKVAEVVCMEDVLCVASRFTGRRSVLLICGNLLFLKEDRRGASQVLFLIRTLRHGRNSHKVLRRLLLPLSHISISTTLKVTLRTFRLLSPQGVRVGVVMAVVVQDLTAVVLVRGEATRGKGR